MGTREFPRFFCLLLVATMMDHFLIIGFSGSQNLTGFQNLSAINPELPRGLHCLLTPGDIARLQRHPSSFLRGGIFWDLPFLGSSQNFHAFLHLSWQLCPDIFNFCSKRFYSGWDICWFLTFDTKRPPLYSLFFPTTFWNLPAQDLLISVAFGHIYT